MSAPWFGFITPLLVRSATQFAPPPPPALTSARYTRDFNEVKALGSANSTERTESQTSTARFFSGNALCSTTTHCATNLADTDGNPATVADPTWAPLLATPPYPDYPSGYNALY
jgi:hypothetical protein